MNKESNQSNLNFSEHGKCDCETLHVERFLDNRGRVRLNRVRNYYSGKIIHLIDLTDLLNKKAFMKDVLKDIKLRIREEDISEIIKLFVYWRDQTEYVVLKMEILSPNGGIKWVAIQCRKRGNKRYVQWIKKRLKNLDDFSCFKGKLMTITTDCNAYRDIVEAFDDLGKRFNRGMTLLKKIVGSNLIGYFRVWECFESGFPHIHVLLFSRKYIHLNKEKLEGSFKAHIHLENVKQMKGIIGYLKKYLTKTIGSNKEKHLKTQSLLWVLEKRSFSVSRGLILSKHNSNGIMVQSTLDGSYIKVEWGFVGVYLPCEIGLKGDELYATLDRPPPMNEEEITNRLNEEEKRDEKNLDYWF